VLLSQADYNEIGQVMTKHLHSSNSGSSFLQNIAYTYNERGWLRTAATQTSNYLNLDLRYNTADNASLNQFNGNISQMNYGVASSNSPGTRSFTYQYDVLNRLTNATSAHGLLNESISYDQMGNIMTLNRTGVSPATLAYTYLNNNQSNQLGTVTNGGNAYRNYGYDPNGNATSDGMGKTITYNLLNLPQTVSQPGNSNSILATYTYDAEGQKLRNTGSDGTWDYISGIVYKTPVGSTTASISFIQTEEGRGVVKGDGSYSYQYNIKDQLGNDRLSFDKTGILQEDEYYAFGLRSGVYDASNNNRYLYNGKERQTDLTDQYDYGARFYDPVIGRFTTIDPHASSYVSWSSYSYVADNPITSIDPDGRDLIVLSAPDHVHGFGHAAVLIGNGKKGYRFYSKNGTHESSRASGPSDDHPVVGRYYASLKDFENSSDNRDKDGSYKKALVLKADDAKDKKMEAAAKSAVLSDYDVLEQSCIDVASDALFAGGFEPGNWNPIYQKGKSDLNAIPNIRFGLIVDNNPQGILLILPAPKKEKKATVTAEPLSKPKFIPNDPPKQN
jgi:RHS repeat-associated protein